MVDAHDSFARLSATEPPDSFRVLVEDRGSTTLVMAIHGGAIEPGTSEVAIAIADGDLSLYLFEGRKRSDNATLHLTSHRFDEPVALSIASKCRHIISVHGCRGEELVVYTGGADWALAKRIGDVLSSAGFSTHRSPREMLGASTANICNRGLTGRGVQLEISRGLRDRLREQERLMGEFCGAVRLALLTS